MAAKPGGSALTAAARHHGPETNTPVAPLSSSAGPSPPAEPAKEPPRRHITRKRAASINIEQANRPKIENLSLATPNTASPRPIDAICLCTPAPKVPRPRNAFILYRQHHQAQVVQQNPGLANPEISKIIGEQWRDEPEDRKNQWKLLAEEEKQRHQRQYPDYRYQPRRGNKSGSSQSSRPAVAPGEDPNRCPKCGGRYIATPRTPSTPFVTPTASKPGSTPYGLPLGHHSLTSSGGEMRRHNRAQTYPHWAGSQSAPSMYDIHEDYERTLSPNEAKRRRYNAKGSYYNFHALPSPPTPFTQQHHTASSHSYPRQSPLSNPTPPSNYPPPPPPHASQSGLIPHSSPGPMMPPPPRPIHSVPITPSGPAPPSLRLPPLQTHLPTTSPDNNNHNNTNTTTNEPTTGGAANGTGLGILHPTPTPTPTTAYSSSYSYYGAAAGQATTTPAGAAGAVVARREREAAARREHARNVEAMVMSIPFVNKLRVLERISPPLGLAGAEMAGLVPLRGGGGGVGVGGRGPVIAVEGPDARLVKAVAVVVERALRAVSVSSGGEGCAGGWDVRCWEDDGVAVPRRQQQQQQQRERGSGSVGGEEEAVMGESGAGEGSASRQGNHASSAASIVDVSPFTAYLRTISEWHAKSAEIVDFVTNLSPLSSSASAHLPPARQTRLSTSSATTTATASSSSSSSTAKSTTTDPNKTEPEPDSDPTPRPSKTMSTSTTQQRHPLPSSSSSHNINTNTTTTTNNNTTSTTNNTTTTTTAPNHPRLPIALLPSGFSLTLADRFACAVPISDAYAPVDHWQWMATLWRGVVGADLVVFGSSFVGGGMGEEGGGVVMGPGTVEVKSAGLIVVKVPVGGSGSGSGYGERDGEVVVDEKMERRLGFEVVEWVRGGGWLNAGRGMDGGMGMEY
ncbi:hypothetical protein B0I37DRAFT_445137 [Chaetomium sp. MPI-CAGE-AT-0009]|nr:hypothetical protein B0I37DRAFT_445137 [Chaetomium sp. MPI-CAGE-AT-0009]